MERVIEVKNLKKSYCDLIAVNDISFFVEKGEVFGLLGENGAGKTTTLEMIEGLRQADLGEIRVLGYAVKKDLPEIKQRIGVQLQSSAYYNFLKLNEILELFGGFYKKKIDLKNLFSMVDMQEKAGNFVNSLSGGQKQRFSIIASLVNDPDIVFLDEPTTGLDPIGRRNTWDIISRIKAQGKTIVLTTHYMEEAEILCDRVAIMEKGRIIAMDKTHRLIEHAAHPFRIEFILMKDNPQIIVGLKKSCRLEDCDIEKLPGKEAHYEMRLKTQADLNVAVGLLQKEDPESLTVGRATLEDIFIELTGKKIEESENNV